MLTAFAHCCSPFVCWCLWVYDLLPGAGCYSHSHWRLASVPHPWQAASRSHLHTSLHSEIFGDPLKAMVSQTWSFRQTYHGWFWLWNLMELSLLLHTQFAGKVTTWVRVQGRTWSLQHLSSQIHVGRFFFTGCLCKWMFPPGLQNILQCMYTCALHIYISDNII